MYFIKNALKFISSKYNIVLIIFIIATYFFFEFFIEIDLANQNVTWIYSTSMQTLAALIALLPISYAYYINNLDNEQSEIYDRYVIEGLKKEVYNNMMFVILYSLVVIVFNLLSFFILNEAEESLFIALLTIEAIGLISIYIYKLFDPNRVKAVLMELDNSSSNQESTVFISLDVFITQYLELEESVKNFISNERDNTLIDKLPLYDIVDIFNKDYKEIRENYDTFKEIIFHRNNLIHNYTNTTVDSAKYLRLVELTDLFDKFNIAFITKNIFGNVVKVKNIVEKCIKEYLLDKQNNLQNNSELPIDFKDEIISLLNSYFVSDYYVSSSLESDGKVDFELIQNNYSENSIVGIDIKAISSSKIKVIKDAYFARLSDEYTYLFLINYDAANNTFTIYYQTKDKEIKNLIVK